MILHEQTSPCAKITPSEISRTNKDFFCFLHDGIVDRDIIALTITLVYHFLLLRCVINAEHTLKQLCHRRLINSESIDDRVDTPNKNTCIPKIIILANILFGSNQIRLFTERINTEYFLVTRRMY